MTKLQNFSKKVLLIRFVQLFFGLLLRVEMGNTDNINAQIGTSSFFSTPVATQSDTLTCVSNCTLVNVTCSTLVQIVTSLMTLVGYKSSTITCPLQYYVCKGNIVKLDKLVSGYYVNQELADGTTISKPAEQLKCSHGGIVDKDTFKPATGGINKDSGFVFLNYAYVFSKLPLLNLISMKVLFVQSAC
jgi:hypothetical protein